MRAVAVWRWSTMWRHEQERARLDGEERLGAHKLGRRSLLLVSIDILRRTQNAQQYRQRAGTMFVAAEARKGCERVGACRTA